MLRWLTHAAARGVSVHSHITSLVPQNISFSLSWCPDDVLLVVQQSVSQANVRLKEILQMEHDTQS